jgi:uncharacterized protein
MNTNDFLSCKSFAIAGSFKNTDKYAYQVLLKLKNKTSKIYPINPGNKEVEGFKCYRSVLDIADTVEAISIVTQPQVTEKIVEECFKKGIKHVWIQPGAESEKAVQFCQNNGINVYLMPWWYWFNS